MLDEASDEWDNAITVIAPEFLNIINTALAKVSDGVKGGLISNKEIWWIIDISDITNLLKLLTDMNVTDSMLKSDFAINDHNPKEADYIQYGVGYSVDGS